MEQAHGPLLILAGAGSGKTRVLTYKVAYLVRELGISPWKILAVTFTNKAAQEMKQRIERLVGKVSLNMWLGTFHSICARILRREAGSAGADPHFVIYDTADQLTVVKKALEKDPAKRFDSVAQMAAALPQPSPTDSRPGFVPGMGSLGGNGEQAPDPAPEDFVEAEAVEEAIPVDEEPIEIIRMAKLLAIADKVRYGGKGQG